MGAARAPSPDKSPRSGVGAVPLSPWLRGCPRSRFWVSPAPPAAPKNGFCSLFPPRFRALRAAGSIPPLPRRGIWGINHGQLTLPVIGGREGGERPKGSAPRAGNGSAGTEPCGKVTPGDAFGTERPRPGRRGEEKWKSWGDSDRGGAIKSPCGPPTPARGLPNPPSRVPPGLCPRSEGSGGSVTPRPPRGGSGSTKARIVPPSEAKERGGGVSWDSCGSRGCSGRVPRSRGLRVLGERGGALPKSHHIPISHPTDPIDPIPVSQ